MNRTSDIDILKSKKVKERDIEMYKLRVIDGESYTDIAKKFGLKSPVSVSRRVKKIQEMLKGIDKGIKSGDIVLENKGVERGGTAVATRSQGGLSLPTSNPFDSLNTFEEIAGMSSAGGAVIGSGLAALAQGFSREDLPYEQRTILAMKGGSVLASSLLSLWLTFNKLSPETAINLPIKEVEHLE
jgi:hypothetical protein